MSFGLKYGKRGIWYGQFSHFPQELVTHAISTRFGGVSAGEFASLNLAMHNGDVVENVIENRRRFAQALAIPAAKLVTAQQVHSDVILSVDEQYAGRGGQSYGDAIAATDALITNCCQLPLMLFFADCVPVLIVDPVRRAIGISHAGWQGTVNKIVPKTLFAMQEKFGSISEDCLIGIGPAIGACCYEVGNEVAEQFIAAFPNDQAAILQPYGDKWRLDLAAANRIDLIASGVLDRNIELAETCSACNADVFFSYRHDHGKTGRIAAVISLNKKK